jgi:hypothetical protein
MPTWNPAATLVRHLVIALTVGLLAVCAYGQAQPSAPYVGPNGILFPLTNPPQPVASATVVRTAGNPSMVTLNYWIVANSLIGQSSIAGPFPLPQAPIFSSGGQVTLNWTPVAGAVSYDVLRTFDDKPPSGTCTCAVATGVTGASYTDSVVTRTAYTVNPLILATYQVLLNTQATGFHTSCLAANGVCIAGIPWNHVVVLSDLIDGYADVCAYASSLPPSTAMMLPAGSYTCANDLALPYQTSLWCPAGYEQTQVTFTGTSPPYVSTPQGFNQISGCSFVIPSTTVGDGVQLKGNQVKFLNNNVSGGAAGGKLMHVTAYDGATQSGNIFIENVNTVGFLGTWLYIDHVIQVVLTNDYGETSSPNTYGLVIDTGAASINASNVETEGASLGGLVVKNSTGGSGPYNAYPVWLFFDQGIFDCTGTQCPNSDAILFDSTLGTSAIGAHFTDSWAAGYGHNGVHFSGGHNVLWVSGHIRANGLNGALIDSANVSTVSLDDSFIASNNTSNSGDAHGVYITAAAPGINITGGHIGNYGDNVVSYQLYGVKTTAVNAPNLSIVGTDLSGNNSGCYSIADTGSYSVVINGTATPNCTNVVNGLPSYTGTNTVGSCTLTTTQGLTTNVSSCVTGYTGTKTAGACVLTISQGIITNVTGC